MDWTFAFGLFCGWIVAGIARHLPGLLAHWHREAFRLWWRCKSRRRGGRPRISSELIALIRHISDDNPLWGAPRIHGELLKLGFRLSQSTVSKYMLPRHGRPGQSWSAFLRNHASDIAAIDMLSVPTLTFQRLYAFLVLGHGRRLVLHIEMTDHPTALWLSAQITEALGKDGAPRLLVRDNDRAYGAIFRRRLRTMGVRDHPTRPHSPWQNGHLERLIGSMRRECLDHHVILGANHLRSVLSAYADDHNNDRTHLALAKDCPKSLPIEASGEITLTCLVSSDQR